METGYCWDTGLLRDINEDSILCTSFNIVTYPGSVSAGLFAVADGMGGHSAGEIASDMAIKNLHAGCISSLTKRCPDPPLSVLVNAFREANTKILDAARDGELQGMGTTLTSALIMGSDMYVAHIGDSRCYIINTGEPIQVTKDHSVVQQLVDEGTITLEQARNHPRRNEITRVLGYSQAIEPDLYHMKLYAGDNVLLCSDGLHGVLHLTTIVETVLDSSNVNQACIDLAAQANLEGGPDNISVVLIRPGNLPSLKAVITAETGIRKL